ncbi:SAM-dependent methyltransferase [Microbacterium radiodurans]|uniref:SAM-dependent methyltransferase n=1 Tax=Microbacterium radiodurans TaxID=661398 RepID=UPI00168C0F8B|nr:SAM-dependent methyltransferase [Microbacterium radiodurans]
MSAPYLYFTDDRLSHAELSAARLDGDVVEIGEGFMPADAVETTALRALSLRPLARPGLALTHGSAAWVHGVRPEPPTRHHLQRLGDRRTMFIVSARVRFRDGRMPPEHTVELAGVAVTTLERTLVDLLRADAAASRLPGRDARALLRRHPDAAEPALRLLEEAGPVGFKRPVRAWLLERAEEDGQDDVTR